MLNRDGFEAAVHYLSGAMRDLHARGWRPPRLVGPDGRPITASSDHAYSRKAASTAGDMRTWRPRPLYGAEAETHEREMITARAIDLVQSDPHAAGVVDAYAVTVIGAGLVPMPSIDRDAIGMDKDAARAIQSQQRAVWRDWWPTADAAGSLGGFYGVQHLWMRSLIQFGESFTLLPMLDDPERSYSLACQVIHPLRVKTPVDLASAGRIQDGIELDRYGAPVAVWIKHAANGSILPDTSKHFERVAIRAGHRWRVLHDFVPDQPGCVRGVSKFAPAMKYFRRFDQYLDAELAAAVVTAAVALFIRVSAGTDPYDVAKNSVWRTEEATDDNAAEKKRHYEYWEPGQVMYGNSGEEPTTISANRPGDAFDPFTKRILKAMAVSVGLPYTVAFKDVDRVSFAGFRSAMLEAWRTYMFHRNRIARGPCQAIYTMLMEEAYLRGALTGVDPFYPRINSLCACDWVGPPKGDIEPFKAAQADVAEIGASLNSRQRAAAERGRNWWNLIDDLDEEREEMDARGLVAETPAADPGEGEGQAQGEPSGDLSARLTAGLEGQTVEAIMKKIEALLGKWAEEDGGDTP
jgi:lambda family phage portal protein